MSENNAIKRNESERTEKTKTFNDEIIEKLNQLHESVLKTNKVTITDLRNVYEKFLELEKSSKIPDNPIAIANAAVAAVNTTNLTTTTTMSNRHGTNRTHRPSVNITSSGRINLIFSIGFLVFIMILTPIVYEVIQFLLGVRCFVPNNYLVWEATRPISDCSYCRNIRAPLILKNITRDEFEPYAYSSRPIIIKKAVLHWPAIKILNFTYLKNLYETIPGALDEDCQFLHFRSDFMSLRDVFNMPDERIKNLNGQKPWYVGWSNCHPIVLNELRKLYPRPHFLPEDAEMPNTDYIFLGYEQGAIMHLDYIPRLMWQAQLQGNKSWYLAPAPECDNECDSFSFYVEPGDAVLVDTRIWYHGTSIPKGQFALTIQSEYG